MDSTKPPRTLSGSDLDGSWTQIRRDALPMGDALYTIQEIPENHAAEYESEVETVLVETSTNANSDDSTSANSVGSSFTNSAPACSSTALSEPPPADFDDYRAASKTDHKTVSTDRMVKALVAPDPTSGGGDLRLRTVSSTGMDLSESSLKYWKTRLEVMENQKRDIRQWMAETTAKIAESAKRIKLVTERMQQEFTDEHGHLVKGPHLDPEYVQSSESQAHYSTASLPFRSSKGSSPEISRKASSVQNSASSCSDVGKPLRRSNSSDDVSRRTVKGRGSSGDGQMSDGLEKHLSRIQEADVESACASVLSDADVEAFNKDGKFGDLTVDDLPTEQKEAEEMLRREKQLPYLKMMADLTDEWDFVKLLYINLKRVGKVAPLQVLKLSRAISNKNALLRENMKNFLASEAMDPAEMMYKFGRDLLTVYHITIVLNGDGVQASSAEKPTQSNASVKSKRRISKDKPVTSSKSRKNQNLRKSLKSDSGKAAERIIRKQNEVISKMFRDPPKKKIQALTNPSYAHVKSRYMESFQRRECSGPKTDDALGKPKTSPADQRPKVRLLSGYERVRSSWKSGSRVSANKEEWDYEDKGDFISGTADVLPKTSRRTSAKDRPLCVRATSPLSVSSSSSSQCKKSTETVVIRNVTRAIRTRSESPYGTADDTADFTDVTTDMAHSYSEKAANLPTDPVINVTQSSLDLAVQDVFGDFSCGDANKLFFERFGEQKRKDTSKTKMTLKNNVKPSWKLTNIQKKGGEKKEMFPEYPLVRRTSGIQESLRPNTRESSEVADDSGRTSEKYNSAHTANSRVPTFAVLAKDKYVCVKLTGCHEEVRESSPTRYVLAEDNNNVGVIRTLYKNLPSLRPFIVDMLLTNIVFAFLLSVAGDAIYSTGAQSSRLACDISEALKGKLRSILIRALRLVDDF